MYPRFGAACSLAALLFTGYGVVSGAALSGCSSDGDDDTDGSPPPVSTGDGAVILDGQSLPYSVVFSETKLLLLIRATEDCDIPIPFHSHVIESTSNAFDFSLSVDDPSASTLKATVNVAGLEADLPENDALYPETEHNEFSDSEIESIEESMNEQIHADTYDTMTFTARDLTTMNGEGTATVDVDIAGEVTEITMNGTATMEPDGRLKIVASGILDGKPYGIYTGFGASCIDPLMPLDLTLVMEPATSAAAARR